MKYITPLGCYQHQGLNTRDCLIEGMNRQLAINYRPDETSSLSFSISEFNTKFQQRLLRICSDLYSGHFIAIA